MGTEITISLGMLILLIVAIVGMTAFGLIHKKLGDELRDKKHDLEATIRKIMETVRENHGIEINIIHESTHIITTKKEK